MDNVDFSVHPQHPVMLTPEGYQILQEELDYLTSIKRTEISNRIRESQQHGEFSEDNSELEDVKFEQAIVENRIMELKTLFANAQVLDTKSIPTDHVGIGSHVTVKDVDRGVEFEVRVVASVEADPDKDLISVESPMGLALLNHKVGDIVTFQAPIGNIRYKITKIRR